MSSAQNHIITSNLFFLKALISNACTLYLSIFDILLLRVMNADDKDKKNTHFT